MSMFRTVLALWPDGAGPAEGVSSRRSSTAALDVEGVQTTLDGRPEVVTGEAAYVGTDQEQIPLIHEDDDGTIEIGEQTRGITTFDQTEWFAVPEANPGFVCFESSDVDYACDLLGFETDDIPQYAHYDLGAVADTLEREGARFTHVGWSEGDDEDPGEAGMWYPNPLDTDDSQVEQITNRGLRSDLAQLGFDVQTDRRHLRGTIAESGYLALFDPDDLEATDWVGIMTDLFLPHAYVPADAGGGQQTLPTGEADGGGQA